MKYKNYFESLPSPLTLFRRAGEGVLVEISFKVCR